MILRLLPALLLLLLPVKMPAADATAASALATLYDVARLTDAAVLDFNMLLGEDQSPAYRARLDTTVQSLDAAGKSVVGALGAAGVPAAQAQPLSQNLSDFLRLLRDNRRSLASIGAPEGAVVDEMMLERKEIRKTLDVLYTDLEKKAGLTGSPLSEARALALQLQQMSAFYIETAAAAGGVAYRTQDENEATIDELARSFTERLGKLAGRAKGEESTEIVQGISTKWRFIEKSMLNYRERTVPFLVDRYTQAIVADLLKLAGALERGN